MKVRSVRLQPDRARYGLEADTTKIVRGAR